MEVDRLTTSQRFEHMKKGLCFECHKPGHRTSDHKAGGASTSTPPTPERNQYGRFLARKPTGKDTYGKIRALMAELDAEEKEATLTLMEESGF